MTTTWNGLYILYIYIYIYMLDRLWQSKCNHVFLDFWKLFAHIIFTESCLFQETVEVDYYVRWVISSIFF